MHLLEMAKTAWNANVTGATGMSEGRLNSELRAYLTASQDILSIFGSEGDLEGAPLEEIRILQGLLEAG